MTRVRDLENRLIPRFPLCLCAQHFERRGRRGRGREKGVTNEISTNLRGERRRKEIKTHGSNYVSSHYRINFYLIVLTSLNLNCIAHNPCQQPCPLISMTTSTRRPNYLIDRGLGLIRWHVGQRDYLFL